MMEQVRLPQCFLLHQHNVVMFVKLAHQSRSPVKASPCQACRDSHDVSKQAMNEAS